MTDIRFVYATAPTEDNAALIGARLVEERLAACVNIIPHMQSIYRWQGSVEKAGECVLIVKTVRARVSAVTDRIGELHPYECPCVAALPVEGGNQDFLDWVRNESSPAD